MASGLRFVGAVVLLGLGVQVPAFAADAKLKTSPKLSAPVAHMLDGVAFKSSAALVVDEDTGEILAAKNADQVVPVASLTKLMTALVVVEAGQPLYELLEVTKEDVDTDKHTPSRLKVGTKLPRNDFLLLALMASENRAASALSRHFPGGRKAFLDRMNDKAWKLGMSDTHFADAAGLSKRSVSSARDLHRLLTAANSVPLIRDYSTRRDHTVRVGRSKLHFINSNRLVRGSAWDIELQKTGFTNEAGRCLVMRAKVAGRRLAMIFLNSFGKLTRYGDASRVRQGLERQQARKPARPIAVSTDPA
jgi:serine-type D-Ala-D-Ala endopeptidase (penicillin-binding protein 7)